MANAREQAFGKTLMSLRTRSVSERTGMRIHHIMLWRQVIRLVLTVTLVVAIGACRAPRTDQTAVNTADTGPYEVLSEQQPEPRIYVMRVRVNNLDKATEIARDIVHQMASQSPRAVRIHVFGPSDSVDGAPRRTIKWPEELDYRGQEGR